MRISDVNSSSKTSGPKKKKGVTGTGAFSAIFEAEESQAPAPVEAAPGISAMQPVLSLDALGLLANSSNEEFIKRENIDWGKGILQELNGIKHQILNGKISYASLSDLKDKLNNIPLNTQDSTLKQIIRDIEIRAAVEMEKLKKISEQTKVFTNQIEG